jgi:hypothetical protein
LTALYGRNNPTFGSVKSSIKKIAGFIFILLGLTPVLFILFLAVQKKIIRLKMKQRLETKQLQTVIIPEEDVIWMEDDEIRVNGLMFDIKTKKIDKGLYTFKGLYDAEETKVIERQENATKKNTEESKALARIFNCLKGFYCEQSTDLLPVLTDTHCLYITASPGLPDHTPAIPTPPPQL